MFNGATSFNQSLHNWPIEFTDVSGFGPSSSSIEVTNMLEETNALQFYILTGDVSNDNLYDAVSLYQNNRSEYDLFYKPIDSWNTSSIVDMSGLFKDYSTFNEDLSGWNTDQVTNMSELFQSSSFNYPISKWNTSNVTSMDSMFKNTPFNQSIEIETSKVTTMESMFQDASSFDQPIGTWDVSNVITMKSMFSGASLFNGDISGWNTEQVIHYGINVSRSVNI